MRYLQRTKSFCLTYQASELELVGYFDSDYQGCVNTIKSTSGLFLCLEVEQFRGKVRNMSV